MAVLTIAGQKIVHKKLVLFNGFLVNDDIIIVISHGFEETVLLNDSQSCILNICPTSIF